MSTRSLPKQPRRPLLLDLFCGAGGAAMGYHRAGFEVVGVDINRQPNYPFPFIRADALEVLSDLVDGRSRLYPSYEALHLPVAWRDRSDFAAIHASPPCQAYSDLAHRTGRTYPELIEPTRELLEATGLPYVIENVEGAPLRDPITLCGTMFPELRVLRHRLFESNVPLRAPAHPGKHPLVFTHDKRKNHYGKLDQDTAYVQVTGGGNCSIANARAAMGIDWMTKAELNEAIPPDYTRWVGLRLMQDNRVKPWWSWENAA